MSDLQGHALVTGGGRGIGANIARELADAGMEVWVTGRTAEQVEKLKHWLPAGMALSLHLHAQPAKKKKAGKAA